MQTTFTPEQLTDPGIARSNEILRTCVHCGFCTATCPTYQVLGDELDSPRGRIYLIKDMLENDRDPDPNTVKHIDRCLSCLACMTTCPSGVHYMHLVDHARAYIEKTYKRPLSERALRWILAQILPYPMRFRVALLGAKIGRPFLDGDVLLVVGRERGAEEGQPQGALLQEGVGPFHALQDEVGPLEVEVREIAERGLRRRDQNHDQQNCRCDRSFTTRQVSIDGANRLHCSPPAAAWWPCAARRDAASRRCCT